MDASTGSRTARVVAVGRAVGVGGRRDEHVTDLLPATDRLAVAAARRVGAGRGRRVLGLTGHAGLRMLAVDAAVDEALASTGADTLVVVGAGYDTRAWRLRSVAGRRVVEVDHPATQAAKRARHTPPVGVDHVLVGADLAQDDLDVVLEEAAHDPTAPTVWLWEAVVPYLPPAAVDTTLAVLARRSAVGSRLVLTTITPALFDPPALAAPLAAPARQVMARLGEPVHCAESDADVAARLAAHGFAHRAVSGARDWAADAHVRVVGPCLDERLHIAERVAT